MAFRSKILYILHIKTQKIYFEKNWTLLTMFNEDSEQSPV